MECLLVLPIDDAPVRRNATWPEGPRGGVDRGRAAPYVAASRSDGPGPGGGIGRRAGFRCQWLNGRGGSSPLLGTTLKTAGVGPTSTEHRVEVTNYLHQGDLPAEVLASAESVA